MTEVEIKLQVPEHSRSAVSRAMRRGRATGLRLQARYFDTPDLRLAAADLAPQAGPASSPASTPSAMERGLSASGAVTTLPPTDGVTTLSAHMLS